MKVVKQIKELEKCKVSFTNEDTKEQVIITCSYRDDGKMELETEIVNNDVDNEDSKIHLILMQRFIQALQSPEELTLARNL